MNKKIVINLDQTDTKAYGSENLIQADAQTSFEKLIKKILDDIEISKCKEQDCKDKNTIDRVHNTILINGKRGMGKTSFILSIENAKKSGSEEKILKNICSLGIIDPTLIETKEHVLLNIITLIKDKIEDFIKCEKCDDKSTKYKDWKESLRKLAGGLSMLDGVGSNHLEDGMWDSPELILEKGLSNAKQGVDLEKNFHIFIDESLNILPQKAFFLILDDIDTSLDKGAAILETLRKYLTSRKLIIAILGDIDLYSTLVRQLQWEKMDPKKILLKYEFNKNKKAYVNQIEHLEEQYLTKVLKPENRINLKNLFDLKNELLIIEEHANLLEKRKKDTLDKESQNKLDEFEQDKKKRLQVELNNKMETQELEKCVIDMIEKIYLTENSGYTKYYERTLLTQSTRSVLQILQAWVYDKKLNENFISRIKHTFYTTIKNKLEPYNLLEVPQEEQFLNLLSIYVLKENISRDNHLKLIPEFSKDDDNIAILYLNALSNFILKPKDYLAYFIKVGYSLERYNELNSTENFEQQKFIDHIALNSGESTSKIAKRLLTTFKIDSNTHTSNPIFFGNLSLSKDNLKLITDLPNLSLFLSRVYNPKGGHYNVISIFNLLGLLADISSDDNVEKILTENNLIRDFYLYKATEIIKKDDSKEKNDVVYNYDISEMLKNSLVEWALKSKNITQKLSMADLSKIWIRFLYNINDIEDRPENRNKNYSQFLDLYFAAFLNAVYIICEQKKGKENIEIKNPSTISSFFYDKLKNYKRGESDYTFFDYLIECPAFSSILLFPKDMVVDKVDEKKSKASGKTKKQKTLFLSNTHEKQIEIIEKLLDTISTSGTGQEAKDAAKNRQSDNEALMTYLVNQIGTASKDAKSSVKKILEEIFSK